MFKRVNSAEGAHPGMHKPTSKAAADFWNEIEAKAKQAAKAKVIVENSQRTNKSKRDLAKEAVERFRRTTNSTTKYSKVSKTDIIDGLLERIRNPESVYQGDLNLCGPAAFAVVWAKYDPEGYAKSVIHLYRYGYFKYNNWTVKANKNTYSQSITTGLNAVDWVLLPAIRFNENVSFHYDPSLDRGAAAYTTHWEMSEWLERIIGVTETRDGSPTIKEINAAYNNGKTQVFLVDSKQLFGQDKKGEEGSKKSNKPNSYINAVTGNHYVILKSKITVDGDWAKFKIWSWAGDHEVKIKKSKLDWIIKDVFKVSET